eukprot:SAG11_NODE_90_length_17153_cov_63.471033_14_plen_120_part_00
MFSSADPENRHKPYSFRSDFRTYEVPAKACTNFISQPCTCGAENQVLDMYNFTCTDIPETGCTDMCDRKFQACQDFKCIHLSKFIVPMYAPVAYKLFLYVSVPALGAYILFYMRRVRNI